MIRDSSVEQSTEAKAFKAAIIYTDGGCKYTNPGFIGWSGHGYVYELTEDTKFLTVEGTIADKVQKYNITTDGYVPIHAKHVASTTKPVKVISYLDFLGSSLHQATNNEAELQAFTHCLERLAGMDLNEISIYTDSQYVRSGIVDRCKEYERYDWRKSDGTVVPNAEWLIRAYDTYKRLIANGVVVHVHWVKGHSDAFGNHHADILASIGVHYSMDNCLRSEFKVSDPKGYWKSEIDRHPFLNFKRVYFNSVEQYNVPGHYFLTDNGGADVSIGKRIPETGLAVVKLRDADQAIEDVKKRQYEIAMETNAIIMMKLDRVFSKEVYPYLSEHGKYSLLSSKPNHYGQRVNLNLNFFDKQPITVETNPTGLSMRALESFNLLEELLDRFLKYRENGFNLVDNNIQMNAHDITSTFYDREEKTVKGVVQTKHTLKSEYVVGFRDLSIDIEELYNDSLVKLKVPLLLGTDLLPRNNLKKLEALSPTVYLLTWRESENSIRYATIIDSDTGIGIWSNFYADKIFFPKPILD